MSWQDQLNGSHLSWLLEPQTPEVRYLALREIWAELCLWLQ
jgi:hypothetical protein